MFEKTFLNRIEYITILHVIIQKKRGKEEMTVQPKTKEE
jgi:hypothetical protein